MTTISLILCDSSNILTFSHFRFGNILFSKPNEFFTLLDTFKLRLGSVRLLKLFVCILICRSVSVMILNTLSLELLNLHY